MNEYGKSDRPIVPANLPNKAVEAAAEVGEGRGRAKGNTDSKTRPGLSAGTDALSALGRVREVARRDKDARFTALLHHVGLGRLRASARWDLCGGPPVRAVPTATTFGAGPSQVSARPEADLAYCLASAKSQYSRFSPEGNPAWAVTAVVPDVAGRIAEIWHAGLPVCGPWS